MGLLDDLGFHFENYVSSKLRDTPVAGDAVRNHLKNEILNNDRVSDGAKNKVAEDLYREGIRQTIRHIKK